jgi:hypothetical protein
MQAQFRQMLAKYRSGGLAERERGAYFERRMKARLDRASICICKDSWSEELQLRISSSQQFMR